VPRFTRAELESFRGADVPDLVGPGVRLVFVGINPGLRTAATKIHFGNPANRFRPALVAAGLLDPPVDGSPGMTEADLGTLLARAVAIGWSGSS
jgi:TDG/mug DNA glycosylase family protein